jgi:hypothetical protein
MREQFMRIAMARLRKSYPFKLQRRAVAAKMWTEHFQTPTQSNCCKDVDGAFRALCYA